MSILRKELTFEGGVNLKADPHTLKSNEWLHLQNMWPYKSKLIGTRPSLLHEQDALPIDKKYWNGHLVYNENPIEKYPARLPNYYQWFRLLTPLRVISLGSLERLAIICVCNIDEKCLLYEQFEGEAAQTVTLNSGDVVLIVLPNNIQENVDWITSPGPYPPPPTMDPNAPTIAGVRLGKFSPLTPSLLEFNGDVLAANVGCDYVVRVVKASTLSPPTETRWPEIDYRFTKLNFGDTNTDFKPDGVITYKNRFVYFKGNKLWFSDPFEPAKIYEDAVQSAYLGVFFDTGLTEDITACAEIHTSTLDTAGASVLAVWTAHSMLVIQGEPALTIASTPEELFSQLQVTRIPITSGCISAASIVKTKYGIIWCGADSVWFMARGSIPVEVGDKISPRIAEQSLSSAGRIFATFDDECYRLVLNIPGVGFNAYDALGEMWCLSFIGDTPTKESAAWFGPQLFTNTDNVDRSNANLMPGGPAGVFCCFKQVNVNSDTTWYLQPYSLPLNDPDNPNDVGTMLGLSTLNTHLGVDITAPYKPVSAIDDKTYYYPGDTFHLSLGRLNENTPYCIEYSVIGEGYFDFSGWGAPPPAVGLSYIATYANSKRTPLHCKRPLMIWAEATVPNVMPVPHNVGLRSALLTMDNPELVKLIDGYELTYKTLNPVSFKSSWWPWESPADGSNIVVTNSKTKVPSDNQNNIGLELNEPVLTSKRIAAPTAKRYNGLTAQLIIDKSDNKIVAQQVANPVNQQWGKILVSTDNVTWQSANLFDFNDNGIYTDMQLFNLVGKLQDKILAATGLAVDVNPLVEAGMAIRFNDKATPMFIDLTANGWQLFGFNPTGFDLGWGVNIISNVIAPEWWVYSTGPVPTYTPHDIHFAKLAIRYKLFEARPR